MSNSETTETQQNPVMELAFKEFCREHGLPEESFKSFETVIMGQILKENIQNIGDTIDVFLRLYNAGRDLYIEIWTSRKKTNIFDRNTIITNLFDNDSPDWCVFLQILLEIDDGVPHVVIKLVLQYLKYLINGYCDEFNCKKPDLPSI